MALRHTEQKCHNYKERLQKSKSFKSRNLSFSQLIKQADKNIKNYIEDLNGPTTKYDLIDIHRILDPITTEYILFSSCMKYLPKFLRKE